MTDEQEQQMDATQDPEGQEGQTEGQNSHRFTVTIEVDVNRNASPDQIESWAKQMVSQSNTEGQIREVRRVEVRQG